MNVTRTITIDGKTQAEYEQILSHLKAEAQKAQGWELIKEPLINRVTAIKTVTVDSL